MKKLPYLNPACAVWSFTCGQVIATSDTDSNGTIDPFDPPEDYPWF